LFRSARCGGTASVAVIPPFSPACRIRVVEGCQLLVGEGGLEVACGGCGSGARDDVVQGGAPYAGLHHHAGTTAIGGVVDGLVAIGGPLPQVVNTNLEAPGFDGLTQQRVAQRVKVLGEDRQDIESHASSSSPSGGVTTRASLSRSTMGTIASLRSEEHTSELQSRFDLVC